MVRKSFYFLLLALPAGFCANFTFTTRKRMAGKRKDNMTKLGKNANFAEHRNK